MSNSKDIFFDKVCFNADYIKTCTTFKAFFKNANEFQNDENREAKLKEVYNIVHEKTESKDIGTTEIIE